MTQGMTVIGKNGEEIPCEIIALFNNPKTSNKYVLYTMDVENEEKEILAAKYECDDKGNIRMIPIENEDEWKYVDEFIKKEIIEGDDYE